MFHSLPRGAGWSVSPEKAEVRIDDRSAAIQDDVNFVFSGFSVSGTVSWSCACYLLLMLPPLQVSSMASTNGPEGVLVTLISRAVSGSRGVAD